MHYMSSAISCTRKKLPNNVSIYNAPQEICNKPKLEDMATGVAFFFLFVFIRWELMGNG